MKNKIAILIAFSIASVVFAQQARTFPYRLSLTEDSKPDAITEYFGKPNLPIPDERYSEDGLALTYEVGDDIQEFTGFALDDVPFTSEFGIIVEFKYAMIDGHTYLGRYGDGMTMFLYDSEKDFEIGSHGASLGYAYRNNVNSSLNVPGLNGGYLAVGLDVYGDFKQRNTSAGEKREGIFGHDWDEIGSHITIRGGQYKNNRYKGYPVLYTINADNRWRVNRASLEHETGDYDYHEEQHMKTFDLRTDYDHNGNIIYNTVIVEVMPHYFGGSEIKVDVIDEHGQGNVLEFLHYRNSFKTRDQDGNLYDFETQVPDNFKIGFAAATGGAYQKHLIKDIVIRLPYEPIMTDLTEIFCMGMGDNEGRTVEFNPYEECYFFSGSISSFPTSGNSDSYIDYDSFRFEDELGWELNPNDPFEYTDPGVGTWEYDGDRTVIFTATNDDIEAGEYSIYFSVKGVDKGPDEGPFGEEVYRSRPTKLTVIVDKCKRMVNPVLPIKLRVK